MFLRASCLLKLPHPPVVAVVRKVQLGADEEHAAVEQEHAAGEARAAAASWAGEGGRQQGQTPPPSSPPQPALQRRLPAPPARVCSAADHAGPYRQLYRTPRWMTGMPTSHTMPSVCPPLTSSAMHSCGCAGSADHRLAAGSTRRGDGAAQGRLGMWLRRWFLWATARLQQATWVLMRCKRASPRSAPRCHAL